MRDLNKTDGTQLPPADHDHVQAAAEEAAYEAKKSAMAFFLEDWPVPSKCLDEDALDDETKSDLRKWRLQTLLAVQPFGLPSLAVAQAYEKMFGVPFDLKDFECDNIMQLAEQMKDIMIIQEPDSTTPLLHPDYPNDKIFHDARLGHDFLKPELDGGESSVSSKLSHGDHNDLISRAWIDRDLDFPEDAVLLGENYDDIYKVAVATVPGSRGLYRARIVSAGDPNAIVIRLETNHETIARIDKLSNEIAQYFKQIQLPIDAYNVPDEFLALDFPCLSYSSIDKSWSRCKVVSRSRSNHNLVYVECIDFGCVYAVNKIFLYLMPRKFLSIPRLAFEVRLAGLKPADGSKNYSKMAGSRARCFSIENYYLDVLLIDMKKQRRVLESANAPAFASESKIINSDAGQVSQDAKDGKPVVNMEGGLSSRFRNRASYSAIMVDRNDDDIDIYLDEVLILETYAEKDPKQAADLNRMKSELKTVLEKIPRPKNPLPAVFPV